MRRLPLVIGAAAMMTLAGGAQAQVSDPSLSAGGGVVFRRFSLDDQLLAQSVSLLLVPVAADVPIGRRLGLDVYGAYASGSIDQQGSSRSLSGMVDTQLRLNWTATPWARVTVGLNLPTGSATHDDEEAQVAAVLAADLLGFREAAFGTGFGVTTGLAAAHAVGDWGLGYGASYRVNSDFEPSEGSSLTYAPGNELRARFVADRNVGVSGKFNLGVTYQHFTEDEFGSNNLFRPGARVRGDLGYSFRSGPTSTWSLYLSDIWRQQSDGSFDDGTGTVVDTSGVVGSQNMIVAGTMGLLGQGNVRFSPRADLRVLSREDGTASGWIAGAGMALPMRMGWGSLTPRARLMYGAIEAVSGDRPSVWGFETELSLRFGR